MYMQRRGYNATSTLLFDAQIPSRYEKHFGNWGNWLSWSVDCTIDKTQSVVDVVNATDDDGGNEEVTESFGDNDEV